MRVRNFISSVALAMAITGAALLSQAPVANASTYDVYSFNGVGLTGFITYDVATNEITGITGSVSGFGNIASLVNNPSFPGTFDTNVGGGTILTVNNLWYTTDSHLDGFGLLFQFTSGIFGNLWGNSPGNYELFIGNYLSDVRGEAAVAFDSSFTTPLPSTWTMLLIGFIGLGYFAYRGTQRNSASLVAA